MKCKVSKSKISGTISCPSNKSYTHRAIFLASLAKGKSFVSNILYSADTEATINACKNFGVTIEKDKDSLVIINKSDSICPSKIDAKNSGTTMRIAAAISSLADGTTTLTGDESLMKRPMQPLLDALESMGARCSSENGFPPLKITGKIKGGKIRIPGNVSSQFISALFITAPRTEDGIEIEIKGDLVSKPYLDATIAAMQRFGATIESKKYYQQYVISPQNYLATNFTVPSDFSSLALLLSANVLVGKDLTIKVRTDDLPQGDKAFLQMLKELDVKVSVDQNKLKVESPGELSGGEFDLSNNPDLLPPLSILILKSKPIKIYNVKHARYKETDRIAILARELAKVGVRVTENEDGLILEKTSELKSAELNSEKDHRLFMAFFIVGMCIGECVITDPDSVNVSYPNFIEDMKRAGATVQETHKEL